MEEMTPFEKFKKAYQGKKVLVMGLGLLGGGVGVARIFAEIGAEVTVTDLKSREELKPSLKKLADWPIKFVLGQHEEGDFQTADLIIRNPAIPRDSQFLQMARKNNIPISMDTALLAKFCSRPIVGITGTRGKTTTATLIYELLKSAGKNALLGGNIQGVASLPLLKKIRKDSLLVLELSSWELQGFDEEKISPHLGLVTNIYPDHLNRYLNMKEYVEDKKVIFKYQNEDDFLVLNRENSYLIDFGQEAHSQVVWFTADDLPDGWRLRIKGVHNRENAAAAYQAGKILGLYPQWMEPVLATFRGVKGRLEEIAEIKGVSFINDTTSTTPEATMVALKTIAKPIILLVGGASKNLDLTSLGREIAKRAKKVVLLEGSATAELGTSINESGGGKKILGRFDNLKKAVLAAQKAAQPGEVVLLSPGCASFGMFTNEFDRGRQFTEIVKKLK